MIIIGIDPGISGAICFLEMEEVKISIAKSCPYIFLNSFILFVSLLTSLSQIEFPI